MGLARLTPANVICDFIFSYSNNETQMELFGYKNGICDEEKYTYFQLIPQQKASLTWI